MAKDWKKEFMRDITSLHRHHTYRTFSDFCECSALAMAQATGFSDEREQRYLDIVKTYDKKELAVFPRLLSYVVEALSECMQDFLGQVYMELELGNSAQGQFFTPYHLSKLMAQLTLEDLDDRVREQGFIRYNEPACGSGSMAIAAAEAIKEAGHNYQNVMHVTAIDVSAQACHMTYIQLNLLHIPAIVIHGNTLSLKEYGHFKTMAHVMGLWDFRRQRRLDAAPEVPVVEAPPPRIQTPISTDRQISLFDEPEEKHG